jgi:hypothetical protein
MMRCNRCTVLWHHMAALAAIMLLLSLLLLLLQHEHTLHAATAQAAHVHGNAVLAAA